ncbi:hypothetical protein E2C01_061049 [Portunus trituberculatus]|uniref:Uncharacterized protein n=1 Tax=Portunus trituberculatus TaxID=210409 RepID=A0A5B7HE08_PORTR|nr:hypothetical protein [Portunus trituberculatus]
MNKKSSTAPASQRPLAKRRGLVAGQAARFYREGKVLRGEQIQSAAPVSYGNPFSENMERRNSIKKLPIILQDDMVWGRGEPGQCSRRDVV